MCIIQAKDKITLNLKKTTISKKTRQETSTPHGKFSTGHTQAIHFLIVYLFLEAISYPLFYAAVGITALELMEEEIVLVLIVPQWKKTNIKGLYWPFAG